MAALALVLGCNGRANRTPVQQLQTKLYTLKMKSPPRLVTGVTADNFLTVHPGTGKLMVLGHNGELKREHGQLGFRPELIVSKSAGAIIAGRNGIAEVASDGSPGTAHSLESALEGTYFAFVVGGNRILVVSMGEPHLKVQLHDLKGKRISGPAKMETGGISIAVAATALSSGGYMVVWQLGSAIRGVRVSSTGEFQGEPAELYVVRPGGALHDLSAESLPGGGALVVWQDSSPGPWSVFSLEVDADGKAGPAARLNPEDHRDALRVALPRGGKAKYVAWGSGIHFGAFSRSGKGKVALRLADPTSKKQYFTAPGGVESFSTAIRGDQVLVLGSVREENEQHETTGYSVYSGVFPTNPELSP